MALQQNKTGHRFAKSGIFFIMIFLSSILLSNTASAAVSQQALRCTPNTQIGNTGDLTNFVCTSGGVPLEIGLLLNTSGSTSQYIRIGSNGNGPWDYAYFVNNTTLPTGATVTAYSANISMRSTTSGITSYGWYELGYYDPDGTTGNFKGLFNSTAASTTSTTLASFRISFNGQSGVIPPGDKLAIRVWMNVSGTADRPYFFAYSNATKGNSSFILDITPSLTYNISGYITNKTSGVALNGATVQINTTPTPTSKNTNNIGYYNFSGISNGTYLISASASGYSSNSTVTIVNGNNKTNINVSLTPVPSSAGEKILVSTDRFVILDDDYIGTPEPGFENPAHGGGMGGPRNSEGDAMKGKSTTMGAYALYLDANGMPVKDKSISFTFYRPGSYGIHQTISSSTDSNGVASAFSDLDKTYYYGRWKVKAEFGDSSASTSFIYNWFGCNMGGPGDCSRSHTDTWSTGAPINSPYTNGYDKVVGDDSHHQGSEFIKACTGCHRSYDGTNGTYTYPTDTSGEIIKSGVHAGIRCENSSCHGTVDQHTTNIVIGSCYGGAGCHPFRTDISGKSTLNGIVSAYSNSTGTYDKYHTPNSTVPCIVCHGPMHNTTKPDESLRFTRNNDTESSQCTVCHTNYNKHKGSMNCTLCHSDDVHAIKVFSQSAGYVNHSSANQGNCTSCHQNATFLNILKAQPRAGNYSGPPAPQIKKPLNHSDDPLAGTKWGSHWTTQQTACIYCHDNTLHSLTPLGRILKFAPGYQMYGGIGTNTSCANCHYKADGNYSQMTSAFTDAGLLIPPEITNVTNWKGIFTDYYNHSFTTYHDQDCKSCHGSLLSTGANMSEFQHNIAQGTAGSADCIACHNIDGTAGAGRLVNFSAMNSSGAIHKNLNNGTETTLSADNKKCWACHGNGSNPGNKHPSNYRTPYDCEDCHVQKIGQNLNFTPKAILNVSQHYWNGANITINVTSCDSCHNRTEMLVGINLDPDGPLASNNSAHYGKN